MKKLSIEELVMETVCHFNANNRGVLYDGIRCAYRNDDTGHKCAVGRCLSPAGLAKFQSIENAGDQAVKRIRDVIGNDEEFDECFLPEYRGFDVDVWERLQVIHDNTMNWDADGMTYNVFPEVFSAFGPVLHMKVRREYFARKELNNNTI